jgi:hypothetical protein
VKHAFPVSLDLGLIHSTQLAFIIIDHQIDERVGANPIPKSLEPLVAGPRLLPRRILTNIYLRVGHQA